MVVMSQKDEELLKEEEEIESAQHSKELPQYDIAVDLVMVVGMSFTFGVGVQAQELK